MSGFSSLYNRNQTLVDYFRQYRKHNSLLASKKDSRCSITHQKQTRGITGSGNWTTVEYTESTIQLGPASIRFQRTLRVPDSAETYLLPPVGDSPMFILIRGAYIYSRVLGHFLCSLPPHFPTLCLNISLNEEVYLWSVSNFHLRSACPY